MPLLAVFRATFGTGNGHGRHYMRSLWTDPRRLRASAVPWPDWCPYRRGDLPGVLVAMATATDHADQPLRSQRHGSTGEKFSEEEHGSLSVQERRRRGRRHDEKGNDRVVNGRRSIRLRWVAG